MDHAVLVLLHPLSELLEPRAVAEDLVELGLFVLDVPARGHQPVDGPQHRRNYLGEFFAWLLPVFWLVVFGLFWKRSNSAAITTMISAWIVNALWSFTSLPVLVGMEKWPHSVVTLVITLAVAVILLIVSETKPGYFKELKLKSQGTTA